MSIKLLTNLSGTDRVKINLARWRDGAPQVMFEETDAQADIIVNDAKMLCRAMAYDTGSLMKSISKEKIARPAGNVFSISVTAGGRITNPKTGRLVDYAIYVHEGTSRQPGKPFLRMAYEWNRERLVKDVGSGLWRRMSQ